MTNYKFQSNEGPFFNPFAPNGIIRPSNVPFYKLNHKLDIMSKISSYSTDILLPVSSGSYTYWDKMSRFSIKCVRCRVHVVALSCCWDMTSHL